MYKTNVKRPRKFFTGIVVSFWGLGTSTLWQTTTAENFDKIKLAKNLALWLLSTGKTGHLYWLDQVGLLHLTGAILG